jgi:hypothetical protein
MAANKKTTSKGKRPAPKATRARKPAKTRGLRCPGCRVELRNEGEIELQEGGTGTALLGGIGSIGEGHWLLERYVCPKCRVVTLREPAVEMLSFE